VKGGAKSSPSNSNLDDSGKANTNANDNDSSKKSKEDEAEGNNEVSNVAWLTIPFGAVLTIFALLFHLHKCSMDSSNNPENDDDDSNGYDLNRADYRIAGIYYCIATAIEIISEPCMIHCLQTFNVAVRAKAEGIASICKALATVFLLSIVQNDHDGNRGDYYTAIGPVSTFGVAQIVYAVVLSIILYRQTKHELYIPNIKYIFERFMRLSPRISSPLFDKAALKLSIIFTFQSIFKHLLTEGDRIILSTLVSSYNSGIYAMVSSYGSIVSRMILLPLEENGRLLFSHYHAQITAAAAVAEAAVHAKSDSTKDGGINTPSDATESKFRHSNNNLSGNVEHENSSIYDEKVETPIDCASNTTTSTNSIPPSSAKRTQLSTSIEQLETSYIILVKLVITIGCFFITFGFNYTTTLLQILAGSKWGNNIQASSTLSVYCSYILCMACNGMTEAFVYGVVDDSIDVGLLSIMHGFVGFIFYILAPFLVMRQGETNISEETIGGTVGLIFANEICMILRSLYSIDYAANYFDEKKRMVQHIQHGSEEKTDTAIVLPLISRVKKFFSPSIVAKRLSLFYHLTIQLLPSQPVLLCFGISFKATHFSKYYFLESSESSTIPLLISVETLMHVSIGVLFLLITLFMMYRCEKEFGQALKSMTAIKSSPELGSEKAKVD